MRSTGPCSTIAPPSITCTRSTMPAALSTRKVVISTATKTLQEQVFFKDIPLLKE